MDKETEFSIKVDCVRHYMSQTELDGVVLGRVDNFAWLGCGADSAVNVAGETGVGALAVDQETVTLVANNIEMERLLTEELHGLEIDETREFPWHLPQEREEIIAELAAGGAWAADDGSADLRALDEDFAGIRYELTEAEVERYRALGTDARDATESAARLVERGMTEHDAAALVASAYRERGICPLVLLVGADDRMMNWRHPIVKDREIEDYVMLAACGRRRGLITAITRLVHFGPVPQELLDKHRAVCQVDATLIRRTLPGKAACDVLSEGMATYKQVGWDEEWKLHHQGGAIGYQPREYKVFQDTYSVIWPNQAFAWNPSIQGTKSEDTILATADGPEMLTEPGPNWPVVEAKVSGKIVPRAGILVK